LTAKRFESEYKNWCHFIIKSNTKNNTKYDSLKNSENINFFTKTLN
jgi:hypothetical protein